MNEHSLTDQFTEPREWVSIVTCRCGGRFIGYGRHADDAKADASRGMLAHLAAHPEPAEK